MTRALFSDAGGQNMPRDLVACSGLLPTAGWEMGKGMGRGEEKKTVGRERKISEGWCSVHITSLPNVQLMQGPTTQLAGQLKLWTRSHDLAKLFNCESDVLLPDGILHIHSYASIRRGRSGTPRLPSFHRRRLLLFTASITSARLGSARLGSPPAPRRPPASVS